MLIDSNTQKVAIEVFLRPTTERSMREIAKLTKLSTATVSRVCKGLKKTNVIKTRTVAKSILVLADLESEDCLFFKKICNLMLIKPVIDKINENHPSAIILYGSYAKGNDTEQSDIDISVIGSKIDITTEKYEKELNRRLHILYFTSEKNIPNNLKQNIINGHILKGGILC